MTPLRRRMADAAVSDHCRQRVRDHAEAPSDPGRGMVDVQAAVHRPWHKQARAG